MLYLVAYNGVLAAGWAYVLSLTLATVADGKGSKDVYQVTEAPLKLVQTAAVLEVVHSVTGLVRSPIFTTAIQVASRIWALWGIINLAPDATTKGSVELFSLGSVQLKLNLVTLLVAWSASEILRYSFYVVKELGLKPPYPLLWLRYSAFIILYPLGVGSELSMAYLALPTIQNDRPLSVHLPNQINFGFDYYYFCLAFIIGYLPGLPQLYMYMLSQRRKILGGLKRDTKTD